MCEYTCILMYTYIHIYISRIHTHTHTNSHIRTCIHTSILYANTDVGTHDDRFKTSRDKWNLDWCIDKVTASSASEGGGEGMVQRVAVCCSVLLCVL